MSSARRSMSSQSSESKRKTAGKITKLALAAVQEGGSGGVTQAVTVNSAGATANSTREPLAPAFTIPTQTRLAWENVTINQPSASTTDSTVSSDQSSAFLPDIQAFMSAREVTAQFQAIHNITAEIERRLGGGSGPKRQGKQADKSIPAASTTTTATAEPTRPVVSYEMRQTLYRGLFDLLTLKLQTAIRTPLFRALELLDSQTTQFDFAVAPPSFLQTSLTSLVERMTSQPSIQVIMLFDQVLSWKPTTEFMTANVTTVLRAFSACLDEIIVKRFKTSTSSTSDEVVDDEEEEESSSSSSTTSSFGYFMSPSEQTRFLLRTVVTYIMKCRKEIQVLMKQAQHGDVKDEHRNNLYGLVQTIGKIMQHSQVHRDVLTQCGLILTVFFQISCNCASNETDEVDQLLTQVVYYLFFAPTATTIPSPLLQRVPVLTWIQSIEPSDNPFTARVFDSKLQVLSRLALLRSIATHSSTGVLLKEHSGGQSGTLLLTHLFPTILTHCKAINPHVRAYALQSLEVLVIKCKGFIQANGDVSARKEDVFLLIQQMDTQMTHILELLYSNWDHPFKAIPGIVKQIFMLYIEIRNLLLVGSTKDASEQKQLREEYWSHFIGQLLNRETQTKDTDSDEASSTSSTPSASGLNTTSSRGVFTMLVVLLPHISVTTLLRINPNLIGSLFQSAKFRPMFGITNQLIENILTQGKSEIVNASPSKDGDSEEKSEEGEKRGGHKRRKDEIKERLKAKAIEAGVKPTSTATTATTAATSPVAPIVYSETYLSQLTAWRQLWLPHIVQAFYSHHAMFRSDVASCTLTYIFKQLDQHPDALETVLNEIQHYATKNMGETEESQREMKLREMKALVTVLKTARRIGLIMSKDLDIRIKQDDIKASTSSVATPKDARLLPITFSQLLSALLHTDLDLRLEVFEFLCHNLQSTELISALELHLLQAALPYLLKISLPNVRAKFIHAVQRFVLRIRDSVNREIREECLVRERNKLTNSEEDRAKFVAHPQFFSVVSYQVYLTILPSLNFFVWFESFLFSSLYPSSPFERICGVLELYRVILDGFIPECGLSNGSSTNAGFNSKLTNLNQLSELQYWQVKELIFTQPKTRVLINLLASNWERVRLVAFEILERFPTPLPGFDGETSESSLQPLLAWACSLCRSARMRDAEGGALTMRLLVKKYVLGLKWKIDYHKLALAGDAPVAVDQKFDVAETSQEAILFFLHSLHQFLRFQLTTLEKSSILTRYTDPYSRVHGSLLIFRLVIGDIPWNFYWSNANEVANKNAAGLQKWRDFSSIMLNSLKDVVEISLSLHIPTNASAALRSEQSTAMIQQTSVTMDCRGHPILPQSNNLAGTDDFNDQAGEQIVVVTSWLAVKEVSLTLGAWISLAPLPTVAQIHSGLFATDELRQIGSIFFSILSCSKHNGVLENAHQGFLAVCHTLLSSGDALQVGLVEQWLDILMEQIKNPWDGETWIRRSRGIAYCLLAILQAEPTGQKQPTTVATIDGSDETDDKKSSLSLLGRCMSELMTMARVDTTATIVNGQPARSDLWKLKVHGLNILRAIFRDSVLAVDALPYISSALTVAIDGFKHENWNVRNSSLITFGALLSKAVRSQVRTNVSASANETTNDETTVGFASKASGGMTATDFFNHFPSLHSFLLEQLKIATASAVSSANRDEKKAIEVLDQQKSGSEISPADWSSDMHPSLYPILLLLSRLVPSSVDESSSTSTHLDMYAFLPFIKSCSQHPYYMARWMSAKAVVSLVPVHKLSGFVEELIQELPSGGTKQLNHNHIHGLLLQLHTLLQFHHYSANLLSSAEKSALASKILSHLLDSDKKWIGGAAMTCALIRELFLQVIEISCEYLEVSAAASTERKKLIVLATAACDRPCAGEFEGVARDVLRSRAIGMVIRSICCLDPASVPEHVRSNFTELILSISKTADSLAVEESLLWTLKRCWQVYPDRMSQLFNMNVLTGHILRDKILAHWTDFTSTTKSNYTIQELSFQILVEYQTWTTKKGLPTSHANSIHHYWKEILAYTMESIDISVKSAAFQLLSLCLNVEFDLVHNAARSDQGGLLQTYLQHASIWLELSQSYMDDEQPVNLRYACVQAIQSSGFLKKQIQTSPLKLASAITVQHVLPPPVLSSTSPLVAWIYSNFRPSSVQEVCITLWSSCILHLLQDENETVRNDMSTLVGEMVEQVATTATKDTVSPTVQSGQTIVSRVLEQSFTYLSQLYWSNPLLTQYLNEIIRFYSEHFESSFDNPSSNKNFASATRDASSSPAPSTAIGSPSPSPSASPTTFKLFEHEKANTVIEELILMELASFYLCKIYQQRLSSAKDAAEAQQLFAAILTQGESWCDAFLSSLASVSSSSSTPSLSSVSSTTIWIGGATFMEETFMQFFGRIFGLSSVLPVILHNQANKGDIITTRVNQLLIKLRSLHPSTYANFHPLLSRACSLIDQFLQSSSTSSTTTTTIASLTVYTPILPVGFLTQISTPNRS